MLSIARMKGSSTAIARYYKTGDYYTKSPGESDAWGGKLAADLELAGTIDGKLFQAVLEGKIPGTDMQLGRRRVDANGEISIEHTPGWDFTFSAPKSVSLLIAAGDERLMGLVEQAARWTMDNYLQPFAMTRTSKEEIVTGKFLYAHFAELWSREFDPAAHIHVALANMTSRTDADGNVIFGSLETRPLYEEKMNAGSVFRAALAESVRAAGYDIVNDARTGFWEIAGIGKERIDLASKRANAIKLEAERRGDTSAETKAEIARKLRPPKEQISPEALLARFRLEHASFLKDYQQLIDAAKSRDIQAVEHSARDNAKALAFGMAKSFERELVVEQGSVLRHGLNAHMGTATAEKMTALMQSHVGRGDLITPDEKPTGGTEFRRPLSRDAFVLREHQLQAHIVLAENAVTPLMSEDIATDKLRHIEREGLTLSKAQYNLALKLLTSSNRIEGVQGVPGAGKSYVVQALARALKEDMLVLSSAPTATAAFSLGKSANTPQMTLAALLLQAGRPLKPGSLLVVDEASMKSLRTTNRLLDIVAARGARVVLIGDTKQLEAVEAGKPFELMQKMGMSLYTLNETHRHKDAATLEAIRALRAGRAEDALTKLSHAGAVIELAPETALARKGLGKTAAPDRKSGKAMRFDTPDQLKTKIIETVLARYTHADNAPPSIIVLDNQTRIAINMAIRTKLQAEHKLSENKYSAQVLIDTGKTKPELRRADHYAPGDIIEWHKEDKQAGIIAGTRMTVVRADKETLLLDQNGQQILWSPRTGTDRGSISVHVYGTRQLAIGDKIQWRANSTFLAASQTPLPAPGTPERRYDALVPRKTGKRIARKDRDQAVRLRNGSTGTVLDIDRHFARIKFDGHDGGDGLWIDLTKNQHWDHGYAITTHKGQGSSISNPIIVAPVTQSSLLSQSNLYTALTRAIHKPLLITTDIRALTKRIESHLGKKTSPSEALNLLRPAEEAEKKHIRKLIEDQHATKATKQEAGPVRFENEIEVKQRLDKWIATKLPKLVAEAARERQLHSESSGDVRQRHFRVKVGNHEQATSPAQTADKTDSKIIPKTKQRER
jgi:conjugative relaxase-like TrwC/TraI family protein